MTIVKYIDKAALKKQLLEIYHKYLDNKYYQDNRKCFSDLVILIESNPADYLEIIENNCEYLHIKDWISSLFIIENPAIELSLENKIQFILNNIIKLPICKCKVRLRALESHDVKSQR